MSSIDGIASSFSNIPSSSNGEVNKIHLGTRKVERKTRKDFFLENKG
jgi:hypothetical protein